MDNPWGSPWADEAESTSTNTTFTKQIETHRPKTPARTPSLAFQPSTTSPWDDIGGDNGDNDFGDWAEMPSEKPPAAGFGLHGGNDGWNRAINTDQGMGTQKDDGFSLSWNDDIPIESTIPEPNLAPSPLPKAEGIVRLPSPDPWSFEPETITTPIVQKREISKDKGSESDAVPIKTSERDLQSENVRSDSAIELLPESDDVAPSNTGAQHEKIEEDNASPEGRKVSSDVAVKEEPSISNENGPPSSRPSSSPSDRSQHDEIFAESPRTSLDEEPKQRPQVPRKVSSKVQELVEHFDTIAKKEDVPLLTSTKATKDDTDIQDTEKSEGPNCKEEQSVDIHSEDDDFGDFGDFEEFEEGESSNEATIEQSEIMATAPNFDVEQPKFAAKKDYGPIIWNPDTSLLVKIYPDLKENTVPERCFIPDNIPHDSFTSTEERKIWYRVSRYGPMRQHSTGDDENYVRVNWKKSKVRDETLKIVARWIEEDRISGRVVLGGGSKAGSIFGWNEKNSKPASISAAFAERKPKKKAEPVPVVATVVDVPREWPKGLVKERSVSHGRSSSKVRRKSSVKSTTSAEDVKNEKASPGPVANFGWNTDTFVEGPKKASSRPSSSHKKSGSRSSITSTTKAPSPKQNRPPRSLHSSTGSVSKIGDFAPQSLFPATKLETILSPSLVKPTLSSINTVQPALVQPGTKIPDSFGDDDDWGEMISSPAIVTTAPVLPLNKLRHKKSQSLVGNVPSMKSTTAAATIPENNHRPSISFDQILSPTYPSSQLSSPVISPGFRPPIQAFPPVAPTSPLPQSNTVSDPWASADFSFFDSAPAPVAAAVPKPKLAPKANIIAKALPKPSPLKASSLVATPINASPSPTTPNNRRSKEEMEQDRIVQGILKTLPDLSYMFNR